MAAAVPELFVRIAGVSGALAVALGAYGAHAFRGDLGEKNVGSLLGGGMLLFSGGCYLSSLFEMRSAAKITPIGGMMLIAGWLCVAL
ncbi:TMEM256 [Branchiostoma lanceolatum]|uniref:TMEM256 protein n=1 Tax=Branchiostoma lanceolatum TaxID=7740 RepID=A0A8J9Z0R9_BRALA|nr:TMEM256 [Branchiostoma lanceolatum]